MLYEDLLNNYLDSNINFKVKSVTFDEKLLTLSVSLLYPNNSILTEDIRNKVYDFTKKHYKYIQSLDIHYTKCYYNEKILKEELSTYITNNFSCALISSFKFISDKNAIEFCFDKLYNSVIDVDDFSIKIKNYLFEKYNDDFTIVVKFISEEEKTDSKINIVKREVKDTYKISYREKYIGEIIDDDPKIISYIKSTCEYLVVAGIIKNIKEFLTKPKESADGKIREPRKYFKFLLSDFTGSINVIVFPNQTNMSKFEKLAVGSEIIMDGSVEDDSYLKGLIFKPKNIMLTNLPKDFLNTEIRNSVPENYTYVFPEEIISKMQVDLFSKPEDDNVCDYLKNNDIVVFDFETTGLDGDNDKIIEIGAVKIHNGKLVDTFSCMVNPEMHIPEDSSKVNHIYDEDVKNAETIDKIIPDFYKYCYNCTIVAYNIDFDYKFLSIAGKNNGYIFDNNQLDALKLAKTALIGQLKSFKLIKVAEFLGVKLDNAHRAVYDAIATAEVFIKLSDYIEKIL